MHTELAAQAHHCPTPAEQVRQRGPRPGKKLLVRADGPAYLLPMIVQKLEALRVAGTDTALFSEVINLNRYSQARSSEVELRDVLAYFTDRSYRSSESRQSAATRIEVPDYFLSIHANEISGILEFQFSFYDRMQLGGNPEVTYLPEHDVVLPGRAISFFVDPRASNYEMAIDNSLARLFPETNQAPVPIIRMGGVRASPSGELVYAARGDTVRLDALESTDPDTPRERFHYMWSQIEPDCNRVNPSLSRSLGLNSNPTALRQSIVPPDTGNYTIALRVNDQVVTSSREHTITLRVIERPVIEIGSRTVMLLQSRSLSDVIRRGGSPLALPSVRVSVDDPDSSDVVCIRYGPDEEDCTSYGTIRVFPAHLEVLVERSMGGFALFLYPADDARGPHSEQIQLEIFVRRNGLPSNVRKLDVNTVVLSLIEVRMAGGVSGISIGSDSLATPQLYNALVESGIGLRLVPGFALGLGFVASASRVLSGPYAELRYESNPMTDFSFYLRRSFSLPQRSDAARNSWWTFGADGVPIALGPIIVGAGFQFSLGSHRTSAINAILTMRVSMPGF